MASKRRMVLDSNVFFQFIEAKSRGLYYETWLIENKFEICISAITKAEFLIANGRYSSRNDVRRVMQNLEREGLEVLSTSFQTSSMLTALASHPATPTDYLKHHLADCLIALIAHEHRLPLLTENTRDMPGWMGHKMVDAKEL